MSMRPVGKDILLNKLFYSESASREESQCCISHSGQIDAYFLSHTISFRYLNVSVYDS